MPSDKAPVDHIILDRAHLDDVLARTLPNVPRENKIAYGFGFDTKGAEMVFVWKKETPAVAGDFEWNLVAAGRLDRSGDKSAAVRFTITK
jgi:hypothetical protein